jgi:hypothetical protein
LEVYSISMRKLTILILPLVAAMISVAGIHGFWWLEAAVAQNTSMDDNMITGTNMTTGNVTMSNTSGSTAKMHLAEGIKALQSGDKEGAMTQLTAAQQAMSGSPEAIKHFEEGMKALSGGDSDSAIIHLQVAEALD